MSERDPLDDLPWPSPPTPCARVSGAIHQKCTKNLAGRSCKSAQRRTAVTLLMAPQSGQKTRSKIQHASIELRDQAVSGVEDVMAQARASGRQISAGVHKQAAELQERGQALVDEQKERVATLVEAGKKVAKGSSN